MAQKMAQNEDRTEVPATSKSEAERRKAVSGAGISLGKLAGIGIRIDWSLLIIFALIVFELGARAFPNWHPEWGTGLIWGMALATAVLFFASVLLHELSHALVAKAQGIPVRQITLFLFGGMTQLEAEPASPKAEFWMAVVGPVVSVIIGIAASLGGVALVGEPLRVAAESGDPVALQSALAGAGPAATLLLWLGPVNLLLGVFNIIPGFPLDGGRVLRSILWAITKNLRKATRWASRVGQVFAWALMAWGVLNFFSGVWISGLWLLLIGWFLNHAARASYQQLLIRQALEDVPVSQVMRSSFASVPPDMPVDEFVRDMALASEQELFPVEVGGTLLGTISVDQVRGVPRDSWPNISVQEIMVPAARLPALPPDAGAEQALLELSRNDIDQLVILEGRKLLGFVRRGDLVRWLDFHEWMAAHG